MTVRIFYPYNPHISKAMHRIRNALIKYAPSGVEFVDKPEDAIHILDFIGQHPTIEDRVLPADVGGTGLFRTVPSLPASDKYVIIYHCPPPPRLLSDVLRPIYRRLLEKAILVIGTYNRVNIYPQDAKINYYRTSWGYFHDIFYPRTTEKKYLALTTGYVIEEENIDWIAQACGKLSGRMVHIGGKGVVEKLQHTAEIIHYENISDSEMSYLYSTSWFTNAMRRVIGFELPAIEGYACGSQPILLDLPCYRYWFNDFGIFVKTQEDVIKALSNPKPIHPRDDILERFKWSTVAPKIWKVILECI